MHNQKGVSLSGFIQWLIVISFVALLAFKIGPSYLEYMTIQKQIKAVASDPEARTGVRRDVESAFSKRAMIEDMKSITAKDLVITKDGDGIVITADYTTCAHVVANLRACMDFSPSSAKR